jgi:hypothetical protein
VATPVVFVASFPERPRVQEKSQDFSLRGKRRGNGSLGRVVQEPRLKWRQLEDLPQK